MGQAAVVGGACSECWSGGDPPIDQDSVVFLQTMQWVSYNGCRFCFFWASHASMCVLPVTS
jgi:hypothetical protein